MLRRGLAAILLLGVSGAAVSAADLDTPMTMEPAVVGPRWQGFSFGGYVSGTWSSGQSVNQSWFAPYSDFSSTAPPSFSQSLAGAGAGLQFGYDKQYGQFVTGIMADYGFIGGAKSTYNYSGMTNWPSLTTMSGDHNWINQSETGSFTQQLESLGTARWRIGFTPDNDWLIYADAGLAAGQIQTTSHLQVANGDFFNGSRSGIAVGYTVGGGVQYAFAPNMSVGLDGLYYNLGSRDTVATANFLTYGGPNVTLPSPQFSSKSEFSGFQLRLTAMYQYDGASTQAFAPTTDPNTEVPITVGMRAGYSVGQTQSNVYNGDGHGKMWSLTYKNAESFTAEPFFDMDIPNWGLYLTGFLGIGQQRNGTLENTDYTTFNVPYGSSSSSLQNGQLEYGQFDLGYNALQTEQYKLGAFIGYTFENDDYNAYGCTDAVAGSNCAGAYLPNGISSSTPTVSDQFTWNAARLGVSGSYTIVSGLTVSGDAAWLPYIHLNGSSNHWLSMPGYFYSAVPGSATSSNGFQVAGKIDYRIAPGFDIGAGVRYWWMSANGTAKFSDSSDHFGSQSASWTSERLQAFLETGYHF
jgi:opacity protein-like surface antigen